MLGNFLMPRLVQWEQQIGRRLRLRDLFVFFTVVEYGSMAKAADKLGVSTPLDFGSNRLAGTRARSAAA
ncbi:hypothetical protein AYJ54_06160 [Bradyrhizobium centrolobii]|uniref:HTH lysR-type domain-containing protein n=1 Tax=Bradyrhizobium centrolobii TaxID=1505087 RepID=A0A176YYW5_9BRAD|nr:LysR family transcriptional regulator [Bradyrhizobium centrolobii]OAF12409.1 hypothetical protein AYJ54_06160 [Bradyrhizobium centrolobii]